ncbi:SDR family oxidoreductase [Aeromicrobium endophyticum]|uniref:NAD-dependent epimerase/dehydratase family protein n=1 Tax=Aeromicrobium endophyticum TaxID=2292704 RepID=A0A371PBR1_9ACTN|nr:SDR family oxidoreductase [Aeromicrobium endophyticum]REK72988.1 NAD-dependent epimerase/dehydratase family protein [Aeromicrobium endophyticum]
MRILLTGASGFIGSAVVPELLAAGHEVTGLARTDAAAATISQLGATAVRGSLDDLDVLRSAAADADAVIHLAFKHDLAFSGQFAAAAEVDRVAIETLGSAVGGDDPALVIASGLAGLSFGRPSTEEDVPTATGHASPRIAGTEATLALADQGVRSSVVRLAPSVHGEGDGGFVARYAQIARDSGFVAYIGDGSNRWPAVHRSDAAALFRLAVEQAAPGSVLHGCAEEGVAIRDLADALGRRLGLPTRSVSSDAAEQHFGWLGGFVAMDAPASSDITRRALGWTPTGPTLLDDVEAGHYG